MRSPTFNYEEFLVEAARQSFISKGNLIWWLGGGGAECREVEGRAGGRKVGVGKQVACPKGGSGVWHVEEQTCLLVQ